MSARPLASVFAARDCVARARGVCLCICAACVIGWVLGSAVMPDLLSLTKQRLLSLTTLHRFLSISKKMNTLWFTLSRAAPDLLAFLVG
jgi:hypothetical protein